MQISMYTYHYTRSGWLKGRVFASRPKADGFDPRQGPSRDFSYGHLILPCVQLLLTVTTSLLVFVLNAPIANHVSQLRLTSIGGSVPKENKMAARCANILVAATVAVTERTAGLSQETDSRVTL